MLRENDVKDTAHVIFLMMIDQGTQDSFGTFAAWLMDVTKDEGTLTCIGVKNMWRYVHGQTGAAYPDGTREEHINALDRR